MYDKDKIKKQGDEMLEDILNMEEGENLLDYITRTYVDKKYKKADQQFKKLMEKMGKDKDISNAIEEATDKLLKYKQVNVKLLSSHIDCKEQSALLKKTRYLLIGLRNNLCYASSKSKERIGEHILESKLPWDGPKLKEKLEKEVFPMLEELIERANDN